jgi:MFS family permease
MEIKKTLIFDTIIVVVWFFSTVISRLIYGLFWDTSNNLSDFLWTWQFILSVVLALILHEFVHIILFVVYNPKRWSAIKTGINLRKGIIYCQCKEPVKVKHLRIVLIMPLILIGIIPYIVSFIWGIYPLMYLSIIMILGSYKDVKAWYHKRNLSPDAYV